MSATKLLTFNFIN